MFKKEQVASHLAGIFLYFPVENCGSLFISENGMDGRDLLLGIVNH